MTTNLVVLLLAVQRLVALLEDLWEARAVVRPVVHPVVHLVRLHCQNIRMDIL